jgi:hypothetical protein
MERRGYIRFDPEQTEVAVITGGAWQLGKDPATDAGDGAGAGVGEGGLVALVLDQSHTGCSLVAVNRDGDPAFLAEGAECVVKAGPLHPMRAVVRWRQQVGPELVKVGVELLE